MKKVLYIIALIFILPFIITSNCDTWETNDDKGLVSCFECQLPYIDTMDGTYRHDFEIVNSPVSDVIPDGAYYVELEISNCYFTGDCYKMFKNQCSWLNTGADQSKPDYYSDINVAACDFSISNNISVFKTIKPSYKEALYFGNCSSYSSHHDIWSSNDHYYNEDKTITLFITYDVPTPFCKASNHPLCKIRLYYNDIDIYRNEIQF